MNVTGRATIYQNQYGYSVSDNHQKLDGTYENHYIPVKFPKTMQNLPSNRDYIEISGFTTPYKDRNGKTVMQYTIMDWKLIKPAEQDYNTGYNQQQYAEQYGGSFRADEVIINPDDLPF